MRRQGAFNYVLLLPQLTLFGLWFAAPVVIGIAQSLHRLDLDSGDFVFFGLGHYSRLALDQSFWDSIWITLLYTANVPITLSIALVLALALWKLPQRWKRAFQSVYLVPAVSSWAAMSLVWRRVFDPNWGLANHVLSFLGMKRQLWLADTDLAMICVLVVAVWLTLGYQILILGASLDDIPEELLAAAEIDGADRVQLLRFITLPMLRPTIFFLVLTSFFASLQVFTQVYLMTMGGPAGATRVVMLDIYETAWRSLEFGYAAAKSTVYFIGLSALTVVLFCLLRNSEWMDHEA